MKKTLYFSLLLLIATIAVYAQDRMSKNPIQWQYSAKKIAEKTYEVHLTAMLESGWHAYSQQQPEEAVAQPTAIKFKSNPLVGMEGKIKEVGKLEKWQDEATGIKANQYKDQVDFVQVVRLKGNIKTSISGSLTYQVCTDQMCLPPRTDDFTIKVGQ